jgi:hypothetical protein
MDSQQSERATCGMGETFINHTFDQAVMSGIYKELLQLNNKKQIT